MCRWKLDTTKTKMKAGETLPSLVRPSAIIKGVGCHPTTSLELLVVETVVQLHKSHLCC